MVDAYLSKIENLSKPIKYWDQTDAVDETTSYTAGQFAETHKYALGKHVDFFQKTFFDIASDYKTDEQFGKLILWPEEVGGLIQKTAESESSLRKAALELKNRGLMMIDSTFIRSWWDIDKWAKDFIPEEQLENVKEESDFREISNRPIRYAIQNGGEALISRVLETKIGWLIGDLGKCINAARSAGKEPSLKVVLSSPKNLSKIAKKESKYAFERRKYLRPDRGISYSEVVTGVRHLALWSGTMLTLSILKENPDYEPYVKIYLKEGEPSERGNIAKLNGEIIGAFCVEMQEYEIGLDSNFYEIIAPGIQRSFEDKAMSETTPERDLNCIETALEVAMKEEQRLLYDVTDDRMRGRSLGDVIEEEMKKGKGSGSQTFWKDGFIPWLLDLPLESKSLDNIKEAQDYIEGNILPTIRANFRLEELND
ncbi:MAG: hypothetical protein WC568_06790 [Candidatus Methanoperedens sp.]